MVKLFFQVFTGINVILYRLTGGILAGRVKGLRILLLTATGRKTGKVRTTPLGHFEEESGYVIMGTNNGFDTHPGWFFNLKSNPHATIQVNNKRFEVSAEIVGSDKRSQLWAKLVGIAPGYAGYAKKTNREIPMVILHPTEG